MINTSPISRWQIRKSRTHDEWIVFPPGPGWRRPFKNPRAFDTFDQARACVVAYLQARGR